MSGALNLQTNLHIFKGGTFFVSVCTIIAYDTCVRAVSMCPIVATYSNAAALPGTILIRITTTTASPGLSSATASVAVFLVTAVVATVFAVITSVVTAPVPIVILISSVMSAVVSVAPAPLDITFVTVEARLHGGNAVKHGLHHF